LLSKGRFVSVIGEVQRLAAPIAKDASQGSIDPELQRTTVEIPWDDAMQAGQIVDLQWLGIRPDMNVYLPALDFHIISHIEGEARLPISIGVDGAHLQAINGGTLELYYKLLDDVRTVNIRESLHAAVLNVGEPRAELPAPTVHHAQGGALDPEKVPLEGTQLIVPMYNGITAGDVVHYQWKGSITGETATDWIKLNSTTDKKPVPFNISYSLVADNRGGTVNASYYVIRTDGRTSVSQALALQIEAASDAPTISSVRDPQNQEIPHNGTTAHVHVTLSGSAMADQKVRLWHNGISKGEVQVTSGGLWTIPIKALLGRGHNFQAQGLYGTTPNSAVRSLTLAAPNITSVKDPQNREIPHKGTTTYVSVTLSGSAMAGQKIQLFHNGQSKGEVQVTSGGLWTLSVTGLTGLGHNFQVQALYGAMPLSAIRSLTVAASATPAITSVKDPQNREIPHKGTTTYVSLILTGSATAGQKIQLFHNARPKGEAQVSSDGLWTLPFTALTAGGNNFQAQALYDARPGSAIRSLTVAAITVPTIASVKDPQSQEIPHKGTTSYVSLTLSGSAKADQKIQLFHNGQSKGEVQVSSGGLWTLPVIALTAGGNNFQARALYDARPESAIRSLTVANTTVPTITSVKDPQDQEIPHNGTTTYVSLTLSGSATAGQKIQLFHNGLSKAEVQVSSGGLWTLPVTALTVGRNNFQVRALYGEKPTSVIRSLTVAATAA
jgi:hypothetical protein